MAHLPSLLPCRIFAAGLNTQMPIPNRATSSGLINISQLNTRGTSWAAPRHVFLSGRDCYALRCALLAPGRRERFLTRAPREELSPALSHFTRCTGKQYRSCCPINPEGGCELQVDILFAVSSCQAGETMAPRSCRKDKKSKPVCLPFCEFTT